MLTPTTSELHTAIEVLRKLGQRINEHSMNSAMEFSGNHQAGNQAGKIEVRAIEQTSRIETVAEQLKNWRSELINQQKHHVSQSV